MKWSEVTLENRVYGPLNENEKNVRGFFLRSIGFDLENLPDELFEEYLYFDAENKQFSRPYIKKIHIDDIVGTKHSCYGGNDLMYAFLQEHRVEKYILKGCVTRGKFFRLMKKMPDNYYTAVKLIKGKDGKYYVGDNGNHRVIFYKLLHIADWINYKKNYHLYWLTALVVDEL